MHERLRGIRRVVEEYEDRMLVGEVALQDMHRVVSFLNNGDELHLAHNFVFCELEWDADAFRVSIDEFEALASDRAWPAWFLENHDHPRVASRFDDGTGQGPARARAALLLLYALRGTPFLYQGEELGLPDAEIPPDRVVDVDGRDPERAPIPWAPPSAAGPGAGFTTGEPWLPLVGDAETLNAEAQAGDPRSTLALDAPPGRAAPRHARAADRRAGRPRRRATTCSPGCASSTATACSPRSTSRATPVPVDSRPRRSCHGAADVLLSTDPDRDGRRRRPRRPRAAAGEGVLLRV